jgi:signal transduction histidine kinase/ActR/RegA family two-component response regulator
VIASDEILLTWLNFLLGALMVAACFGTAVALLYSRSRGAVTFRGLSGSFAVLLFAAGTSYLMSLMSAWWPAQPELAAIQILAAIGSTLAAMRLWKYLPAAVALGSPEEFRKAVQDLRVETEARRRADVALKGLRAELEQRIEIGAAELTAENEALHQRIATATAAAEQQEIILARERAARAEAEQESRTKDEFLSKLSHELRTPLNAITTWVHLLREGVEDPAELSQGLMVIERNVRAQTALIEDLLDMSRIISGRLRLEIQRVDLARLVSLAVEAIRPVAQEKNITLVTTLDPAALAVAGEPGRLQQVLVNLLSNAVKFTSAGGRVELSVACVAWQVEISVTDTGVGISPELLAKVFDRFQQADGSTSRQHGGLGLGLSIARHLVELHGGTIRAASGGPGTGSTFSFKLPLLTESTEPVAEPAKEVREASVDRAALLRNMKILLVDDDFDTREALRRILDQSRATVLTAGSVEEGIAQLRRERPAVLISDIGMPGEDGYSFIKRVRKLPPEEGGLTPAVALTAFTRSEDRTKAMVAGFQMHLAKPIEPSELLVVLTTLVSRPKGMT